MRRRVLSWLQIATEFLMVFIRAILPLPAVVFLVIGFFKGFWIMEGWCATMELAGQQVLGVIGVFAFIGLYLCSALFSLRKIISWSWSKDFWDEDEIKVREEEVAEKVTEEVAA